MKLSKLVIISLFACTGVSLAAQHNFSGEGKTVSKNFNIVIKKGEDLPTTYKNFNLLYSSTDGSKYLIKKLTFGKTYKMQPSNIFNFCVEAQDINSGKYYISTTIASSLGGTYRLKALTPEAPSPTYAPGYQPPHKYENTSMQLREETSKQLIQPKS